MAVRCAAKGHICSKIVSQRSRFFSSISLFDDNTVAFDRSAILFVDELLSTREFINFTIRSSSIDKTSLTTETASIAVITFELLFL